MYVIHVSQLLSLSHVSLPITVYDSIVNNVSHNQWDIKYGSYIYIIFPSMGHAMSLLYIQLSITHSEDLIWVIYLYLFTKCGYFNGFSIDAPENDTFWLPNLIYMCIIYEIFYRERVIYLIFTKHGLPMSLLYKRNCKWSFLMTKFDIYNIWYYLSRMGHTMSVLHM